VPGSGRLIGALLVLACGGQPTPQPTPAATRPGPTQAECVAAVAHLRGVMPAAMGAEADDVADCVTLPRPVVLCLGGAADRAAADRCVAAALPDAGAR
jgi:hypothetical protein